MHSKFTALGALVALLGCADASDDSETTAAATDSPTTGDDTNASASASDSADDTDDSAQPETSTSPDPSTSGPDPSDGSTGELPGSTGEPPGGSTGTGEPVDTDTAGMAWHPEFIWFADFVREKCVACHNAGQNGNLLLPSVDMTNEEVMMAFDGGVATTGRLFIEPYNPDESQAYIMITNDAGEQFPQETIDRFAAWINLGAPYYEE